MRPLTDSEMSPTCNNQTLHNAIATCTTAIMDDMRVTEASLSKPHINGTAVHELYIILFMYFYGTLVTQNNMPMHDIHVCKCEIFYCTFSCPDKLMVVRSSILGSLSLS